MNMKENNIRVWPATHCPLTDRSDSNVIRLIDFSSVNFDREGVYWVYPEAGNKVLIVTDELFKKQEFWRSHRREIEYLIFNNLWQNEFRIVDSEMLEAMISSSGIPNSPLEKLREVIFYFKSVSSYFGQAIDTLRDHSFDSQIIKKTGVLNSSEFVRILQSGIEFDFLKDEGITKMSYPISLTFKGWEEAEKLESRKTTKIAFIAMSFDPEMIQIYNNWIEPSIRESGFEPYIVLDQHPESDVTINDAILAGIKKAKFTIADFTHHKAGVYFEAGFALGRGQKVIYTCREDQIGTAHFDTRNYQHLVWKDGADLKK
jgi:hypothetical protein